MHLMNLDAFKTVKQVWRVLSLKKKKTHVPCLMKNVNMNIHNILYIYVYLYRTIL